MFDKSQIPPQAELVGACGTVIGRVEAVEGDYIRVLIPDAAPAYLPLTALADQEGNRISTLMNHMAARSLLQDSAEPGEGGSPFTAS